MSDLLRLFDAHHAALFRYLVRLCGEPDLAADGAQEAFVRALESPPPQGAGRAWLFTVGSRYVLEQRRTGARRAMLGAGSPERAPMADPPRDAHVAVEAEELRRAVRAALDTLPPRDRTAVLMREEGFSHREIGEAVGVATSSVGTLIARAHERLARELELDREEL